MRPERHPQAATSASERPASCCSRRRARLRNALAAESAKARRKAGKRLGAATFSVSVRSLTPPLQLFELEGPQRAAFVTSKPENRSRLHISGERCVPVGGEVPDCGDHVVRPGYKRPRAHAVARSEALHRLPRRLGTFRYQRMLQTTPFSRPRAVDALEAAGRATGGCAEAGSKSRLPRRRRHLE